MKKWLWQRLLLLLLVQCVQLKAEDNLTSTTEDLEVVFSLSQDLELFSGAAVAKSWPQLQSQLGATCRAHLHGFLMALRHKTHWALKMEDASGRYSTGLFWGNNYWLGSKTLCDNIAPPGRWDSRNVMVNDSETPFKPRRRRDARASVLSTTVSPSSWSGYDAVSGNTFELSLPFPVSFYSLRLNLQLPVGERGVSVGVCLPRACSEHDVRALFQSLPAKPKVTAVKATWGLYRPQDDTTFRVLAGATIALVILLAVGTAYDLYLQQNKKHALSIPDIKIHNGKSAVYVVNNNNPISDNSITESSEESAENGNPDRTKILSEMLLSFSIRTNWQQICDKSVGSDTVSVVHGLRAISMAWVILGHTCLIAFKYSDNMAYRRLIERQLLFQIVANGAYSVDTFFFISGFLVSFLYFRTNSKGKLEPLTQGSKGFTAGCIHFVGLLGYRLARLTAPYLYVLGIVAVTMKWFAYNSVFDPPAEDHINCANYWWRNILYVNTLFPVEQMCMLWSWYLSDDTQFYVVGSVILILATSYQKTAFAMGTLLLLSSWLTTGFVAYSNSHTARTDDPLALFDKLYDKPWTRLGPYLVGMLTGWFLFRCNGKPKFKTSVSVTGWIISAVTLLGLVFGLHGANPQPLASAAHGALSHSAWAIALAWVIVACAAGRGSFIAKILSAPALYPFSRVTYCAYLVHPILLRGLAMQLDAPIHLDAIGVSVLFLGLVVASYGLAFLISLIVEAPIVTMLKILTHFKVKKTT